MAEMRTLLPRRAHGAAQIGGRGGRTPLESRASGRYTM